MEYVEINPWTGVYDGNRTDGSLEETISHGDLDDMPDIAGTNSDHDARYYTETETDGRYLLLDCSNDPLTGILDSSSTFKFGGVTDTHITADCVCNLHMNEGSWDGTHDEVVDTSGKNNHGTAVGAATTAAGHLDQGGTFDGTADGIDIDDTTWINKMSTTLRTFCFWLKPDDTTTRQVIYKDGGATTNVSIYLEGDKLYAGWHSAGVTDDYLSITYDDTSAWHFVTFTIELVGGTTALYLDNVEGDTSTSTGAIATRTGDVNIAHSDTTVNYHDGASGAKNWYNGMIDEFSIYNKALNTVQRTALYNDGTGTEINTVPDEFNAIGTTALLALSNVSDTTNADLAVEENFYVQDEIFRVVDGNVEILSTTPQLRIISNLNVGYYVDLAVSYDASNTLRLGVRGTNIMSSSLNNTWFPNTNLKVLSDTNQLYFGLGDDYSIGWDGNNAVHTITAGDFRFVGGNVGIFDSGNNPTLNIGDTTSGGDFGFLRWVSATDTLNLGTTVGGTFNDQITLLESGNVGINQTTPLYKLDIDGGIGNSANDLEIMANGENDIIIAGGTDISNDVNGVAVYLRRKVAEGDGEFKWYIDVNEHGSLLFNPVNTKDFFVENTNGPIYLEGLDEPLHLQHEGGDNVLMFEGCAVGENRYLAHYGWITAASGRKYIAWQVSDTDDYFHLGRQDVNVLGFKVDMPMQVGDGTNYTEIETDGTLEFIGTATVFDDLRTPVNMVKVPALKAPTWTAYNGTQLLGFSYQAVEGNEEEIYFTIQLPHSYKEGSDVVPHVHWVPNEDTTDDPEVVRWGLEYEWQNIDGTFAGTTTIWADGSMTDKSDDHLKTLFAAIDGTGKTISSVITCRLFRNSSSVNDTYDNGTALALFLEVDFHYEMDTVGSRLINDTK